MVTTHFLTVGNSPGEVVKQAGDDDGHDIIDNGEHCIVEGYNVDDDIIETNGFAHLLEADPEEDLDPVCKEKNDKCFMVCTKVRNNNSEAYDI